MRDTGERHSVKTEAVLQFTNSGSLEVKCKEVYNALPETLKELGTILWVGLVCVSCYEWKDGRRGERERWGKWKEMRGREWKEWEAGIQRKLMEHLEIF